MPTAQTPTTPSREALNNRQFGSSASDYVASAVHSAGADLEQIAEIARTRLPAGARVLDLGCGGGHVSYAVAPYAGSVTAYDLSAEMVAAVEKEAAKRGLSNVATAQGAGRGAALCRPELRRRVLPLYGASLAGRAARPA